jgi:endonuclease YncB( thermonuclease family)
VNEVCRLEGIDAPELNTEEGRAAKAALTLMVWEQGPWFRVFTVKANERDKYGRFLATIYPANKDGAAQDALVSLQQQMINTGHGRFYDGGKR